MAMLAGRQHFVSSGNHPKSHSPGGGRHLRVHNRTQPIPGCTICKAGTITRSGDGSWMQMGMSAPERDCWATICMRTVPPQRESIKDYRRITCEKGKYLAKQPQILRNEPTSSQKTMNQTVKTMHRIALVFAMESCMKNAWKSMQTQRMQSCFFAMV